MNAQLSKQGLANTTRDLRELTGVELEVDLVRIFLCSPLSRVTSRLSELLVEWWNMGTRCESPIERQMAWAMLGEGLRFTPQVQLGDFTADFVLTPDVRDLRIVVECDGHDWVWVICFRRVEA